MKRLEFKILTDGDRNGESIYLVDEDIRRVAEITIKSDSTYLIGQSKMVRGSVLFMNGLSGTPTQSVQESPEEVIYALGGAEKVENLKFRKDNEKKIERAFSTRDS